MVNKEVPLPIEIIEEKVGKKTIFVAWCPVFDIASQGKTVNKAMDNLQEALNLYSREPGAKQIVDYSYKSILYGELKIALSSGKPNAKIAYPVRA